MDNEFILQDRIQKIQQIINKYGEENFYISFSGGKDSVVLHNLIDMAIPDNKIPRIYSNTGIELNMIVDFVKELQKTDDRIVILTPSQNIKETLEKYGYPFKSKMHSTYVKKYQKGGLSYKSVRAYLQLENTLRGTPMYRTCPQKLKYQFSDEFNLKISDACCIELKEKPIQKYIKENNKKYGILGIMKEEGGRRFDAQCLSFKAGKFNNFQPLVAITKEWEDWYIETYNVKICDIYKEPYNFRRTGCKGCPFALDIQKELDILEKYFPAERKQCEYIWKPVYDEYRRINYRLKGEENEKK